MPTYQARRTALSPNATAVSHAGLLLNRYLAEQTDSSDGKEREVAQMFDAARNGVKAAQGIYKSAFERWELSLPAGCNKFEAKTPNGGRLIVGLGGHHVLETGLTLHHTYGVPYIPGTAIKGLAAHYCHTVWGVEEKNGHLFRPPVPSVEPKEPTSQEEKSDPEHPWNRYLNNAFRLLFGTQDEGGLIRFHDAWLTPDSLTEKCLLDDVMTPHHGDYNMANDSDANPPPPSDFDNPVPVSFLSVSGRFLVALSFTPGATIPGAEQSKWLERAASLVGAAFQDWGIGGKTSSGYGRLESVNRSKTT